MMVWLCLSDARHIQALPVATNSTQLGWRCSRSNDYVNYWYLGDSQADVQEKVATVKFGDDRQEYPPGPENIAHRQVFALWDTNKFVGWVHVIHLESLLGNALAALRPVTDTFTPIMLWEF